MRKTIRDRILLTAFLGIVVMVFAVVFWQFKPSIDQQANARVEKCGGRVEVEYDLSYQFSIGNQTIAVGAGSPPTLIAGIFASGKEFCSFDLSNCVVSDRDAAVISRSSNCAILSLRDCSLEDAGLTKFLSIPSLQILDLRGISVDHESALKLTRLGNLRVVILDKFTNPELTGRIRSMASLSQCEVYVD